MSRIPKVCSIDDGRPLPDARTARGGLVAVGGAMSVERLLEAYRGGIFPWTSDPVTWWSPDPRAVLDLENIHIPRRLAGAVRGHPYRVTFDAGFDAVMEACAAAERGDEETWITAAFLDAYKTLHRAGYAHSIELWRGKQMVAGIYGVAVGGLFAGESMFHREANASKIALVLLQRHLGECGFTLFDTQVLSPVTEAMGARLISRDEYLELLAAAVGVTTRPIPQSPRSHPKE